MTDTWIVIICIPVTLLAGAAIVAGQIANFYLWQAQMALQQLQLRLILDRSVKRDGDKDG